MLVKCQLCGAQLDKKDAVRFEDKNYHAYCAQEMEYKIKIYGYVAQLFKFKNERKTGPVIMSQLKNFMEKYEYKELCSPLKLINKSFPPVFLIYAEKDIFCSGQAELLAEKLKKKDVYYEKFYSTSPFINHCFSLEWKNKPAELVMTLQESFLEKVKKGELPKKLSDTMTTIKEGKTKK